MGNLCISASPSEGGYAGGELNHLAQVRLTGINYPNLYPEALSSPVKLCSLLRAPLSMGKRKEQRIYPLCAPPARFASTLRSLQAARGPREQAGWDHFFLSNVE